MKEKILEKKKEIFVVALVLVVVFSVLQIVVNRTKDYTSEKLNKNKNTIFSVKDLTVDDLKYTDSEKTIIKKYGKANSVKKYTKKALKYKKLNYKGITFVLRENYSDYMLIGVEITNSKYNVSRKINVGDNILKAIKQYKIDNEKGNYMYGNYSVTALKDNAINDIIFMGVRGNKEVTYIYRDKVIDKYHSTILKETLTYKHGKITKIEWLYDYE